MITQQTNYSDIAALHKQSTANQNTVAGNKNISSMLSQIQDEGPAYAGSQVDSQRSDDLINLSSAKSNETPGYQQNDVVNNEKKQPDLSAQFMRNRNTQAATGLNKNKTTWIQLSLILFVALALTFFLFRLDARTDQLEVSLNSHEDDVLDSIDSYTSELSPEFRSIKKTLKVVKQELELIKASTVSATKVEGPVVNEQFQSPSISDNIGIMDDEILALKNELKIAKDKLKALNVDKARAGHPAGDDKNTVAASIAKTEISTTGWVVNLASFTNINKTEKALEPLYAAGLSPLIQEANVNGQRIYRLIIDGFASQADAKLFVRRADEEFGLQGGWIRKS
jgi:hypothetical protein